MCCHSVATIKQPNLRELLHRRLCEFAVELVLHHLAVALRTASPGSIVRTLIAIVRTLIAIVHTLIAIIRTLIANYLEDH